MKPIHVRSLTFTVLALLMLTGCETPRPPQPVAVVTPPAPPTPPAIAPPLGFLPPPVRIKAGPTEMFLDAAGHQWLPERGFVGGQVVERSDIDIANTQTPKIYRSEHYSMSSFSYPVPNGKYVVKLHFAETFSRIDGPGQRVFSFDVEGHPFADFDIWAKAGGARHAYVETVNVEVTDGKLDITFTPKIEKPEINGIEILPAP